MDYLIAFIAAIVVLSIMPDAFLGYLIAGIGFRQYPRAVAFGIGWALVTELIVALHSKPLRSLAPSLAFSTIRAVCRGLLDWTVRDLAKATGVESTNGKQPGVVEGIRHRSRRPT
jgi:hypothetical protein